MRRDLGVNPRDHYGMAEMWACCSLEQRLGGAHEMTDARIADVFGGEWLLDADERRKLAVSLGARYT